MLLQTPKPRKIQRHKKVPQSDFWGSGKSDSKVTKRGKSKGGLTNGGLSPKFSEKIGGKSFLENRAFSGQIGAISGLIGAFSGPIGTNSSAPHSHGGRAEIAPKGPFLARLAPFGLSPPLLSPRLDFPESENGLFKEKPSTKAIFPFSRGKDRISQGVENRGSLISVPLALRVFGGFGVRSQWARRGRLMSRGKNCRETTFVSCLSRNYPHRGVNFERG